MTKEQFERKFILIDCRYPYEYGGGHIKNAVNLFDAGKLDEVCGRRGFFKFCGI